MKRLLFIPVFFFLVSLSFAATDTFEGETITSSATIEGCSSCDTIEGQTVASGAPTYLLSETFDGSNACGDGSHTNCDVSWTVDGAINFDDTGLEGSYGCNINSASGWDGITSSNWAGNDTIYGKFLVNFAALNAGGDRGFIRLNTEISGVIYLTSSDTLKIKHGTVSSAAGSTTLSASTTYYIWYLFTISSGSNDGVFTLWINTSDSKPGSSELSITNGDSTTQNTNIEIRTYDGEFNYTVDSIKTDDVSIN